jgi:hypothetical protein
VVRRDWFLPGVQLLAVLSHGVDIPVVGRPADLSSRRTHLIISFPVFTCFVFLGFAIFSSVFVMRNSLPLRATFSCRKFYLQTRVFHHC